MTAKIDDKKKETTLNGVVIGVLMGLDDGVPRVVFPGNLHEAAIPARNTVPLANDDIGGEVALMFEGGDPSRPIVLGRLLRPADPPMIVEEEPEVDISVDGQAERVAITGEKEVVLRCGKASITLTRAGKIILRGAYISSRSSGMNRIKGGSVQLN